MRKIIFLDFNRCKIEESEENKFLDIYFGIMENEKKNRYIFFYNFPVAGNEKNKIKYL